MLSINNNRQVNIDLTKCLSIIFMILIHTMMVYVEDLSYGVGYVVNSVLGGPLAAPVFMLSMGVGFAYSKNQSPEKLLKRGINAIALGYILNLLISPMYIGYFDTSAAMSFICDLIASFFFGDILQFAGITMVLFSLFRWLKFNDNIILIIGVVLSLICSLIPTVNTNSYLLALTSGLFVPILCEGEVLTCFPLGSWFIFSAFGYWFGNRLKRVTNLNKFYLIIGLISLPVAVIGLGVEIYYKIFMMSVGDIEFYFMHFYDALLSIFAALAMYSICYFAVKLLPCKINNVLTRISSSLNIIYMLSWLLIVYTQLIVYCFVDEVAGPLLYALMALTTVVSIWFGVVLKRLIVKKLKEKPNSLVKYINI